MAWVAVDRDGSEIISESDNLIKIDNSFWANGENLMDAPIYLPYGAIQKLIGRKLTWEDEPVKLPYRLSTDMSDELIQTIKNKAEEYVKETAYTFASEHQMLQYLKDKENIINAYFQGAWDMYSGTLIHSQKQKNL